MTECVSVREREIVCVCEREREIMLCGGGGVSLGVCIV